jgi:hypothetical protein
MTILRQSTASQEILLGPFLDDTDGKTAETALTIANTDIRVWKHGATTEASKNSGGATHIAGGRYYAVLDATDTDTVGNLEVNVHVAGALPVRRSFVVLPANVFDAMTGADRLQVEAAELAADVITAAALAADTGNEIADAFLSRDLGSGAGAGALNERTVRAALRLLRNKWSIAAGTLTVTKEDDAATAWTSAVGTQAGANPIVSSDPA